MASPVVAINSQLALLVHRWVESRSIFDRSLTLPDPSGPLLMSKGVTNGANISVGTP